MSIEGEASRLHDRYKRGEISPVELTQAQLTAIANLDQAVNAFVLVDIAVAMSMARASEARYSRGEPLGPLDGIPVTIKDTLNVAGWPTRRGSRTTSENPVSADAVSISRLRAAGAVFLGKTTTPEFAWKGLTDSPFGGVTRNPLDLALCAGGSSGGAAAAIASGLGIIGIGTDAAGSVRIPAAFCGTVGYKPTFGEIPLDPYPAAFSQLPHIGPITRTVADAALAASVMSGAAASDWTSLNRTSRERYVSGPRLRIGIPDDVVHHLDPDLRRAWDEALAALSSEWKITAVKVPLDEARDIVGSLYRLGCAYAVSQVPQDRQSELDPALLDFLEPLRGLGTEQLLQLLRRREEIASRAAMLLINDVDILLTPTMPCLPPRVDAASSISDSDWLAWCPFTPFFNLTHGPALSVPWWRSDPHAFPIGLQIGAAPGRDETAIAAAAMIEKLAAQRRHHSRGSVNDRSTANHPAGSHAV